MLEINNNYDSLNTNLTSKNSWVVINTDLNKYTYSSPSPFYGFSAATAGTSNTEGEVSPNSICPSHWKLPSNSGSDSWYNLLTTAYNISSGRNTLNVPISLLMNGYYNGSAIGEVNVSGSYWSDTWLNGKTAPQCLVIESNQLYPQYTSLNNGYSIRCVAL